ncbi:MAG: transcriptional regulator [Candidatus Thermoplasmatota archaeon]|nr:transcriptional regulator [Candidatus Thermoplasmatota archaeon]
MDANGSLFEEVNNSLETLKRHVSIIKTLLMEQPLGIIKISQETGIPEHKIRYSLRILERSGIIAPSREGAILNPDFVQEREKLVDGAKSLLDEMDRLVQDLKDLLIRK